MKLTKKIIALLLAVTLAFSGCAAVVYANEDVADKSMQTLYTVLDKVVGALVKGITAVVPSPRWGKVADYTNENFYSGSGAFLSEAGENAVWSVGYAADSLCDGKELDGEHYIGGSLAVEKKTVLEVADDMRARTVAIGDGKSIAVFSCLDAYGLANSCVNIIRSRFASKIRELNLGNIVSVNVSVLHQHSCVDTFGMNGDIVSALFTAPFNNIFGIQNKSGQNPEYMEHLYNTVVDTMVKAVKNMETGKLYYGSVDVSEYINDKRDIQVFDPELHRLRFAPDNEESKETWIVNGAIHCVGFGANTRGVTGDYPLYMEKYIAEKAKANMFYIQGAELAISTKEGDLEKSSEVSEIEGDSLGWLVARGRKFGERLCGITADSEKEITPVFNIAHKQIFVPIDNYILVFAAKFGLLTNTVLRDGLGYCIPTEVGLCEFGKELSVAIIGGELAPEIAFGGAMAKDYEYNWTGEEWTFSPMKSVAGDRDFIVFGLTNDQIGYILADNDYHSIFTENEEIVSSGPKAGSTVTKAFLDLARSCGR